MYVYSYIYIYIKHAQLHIQYIIIINFLPMAHFVWVSFNGVGFICIKVNNQTLIVGLAFIFETSKLPI